MPAPDALIIARAAHFVAMIMLEGALVYRVLVFARLGPLPQADNLCRAVRPWLGWIAWSSLVVGFVSGAAWLVLIAAQIAAVPVADAVSQGAALTVLRSTQFGGAWQIRAALMLGLALLMLLQGSSQRRPWRVRLHRRQHRNCRRRSHRR